MELFAFNWDATNFFRQLTAMNRLAIQEGFTFCQVSGLEGFEEAVNQMQNTVNFVCVSDIADGYTELNNTPHTRRVKTVFLAMRHAAEDMTARNECMDTMRELFRQFMTKLIPEKVRLEQNCIYIDPRISFNEIDRYFFSGAACAYFQIAVDVYTDLRLNSGEWLNGYDLWMVSAPSKVAAIRIYREYTGAELKEAKAFIESLPQVILEDVNPEVRYDVMDLFGDYVVFEFRQRQS